MWGAKRRLFIFISACTIGLLLIIIPIAIRNWSQKPECTDDRQNGDETGIDCGGSCVRVCREQSLPLLVEWSRILPVAPGVYSLAFSVQNRNYDAIADDVAYRCQTYDSAYVDLQTHEGAATFSPSGKTVVVITGLPYPADTVPSQARCQLSLNHEWLRLPKQALPFPFLYQNVETDITDRPAVSATVVSSDPFRKFKSVRFVASVYDTYNTLVGSTTTTVDTVIPNQYYPIVFTWPTPFTGTPPYRAEITPLFEFPEYQN